MMGFDLSDLLHYYLLYIRYFDCRRFCVSDVSPHSSTAIRFITHVTFPVRSKINRDKDL